MAAPCQQPLLSFPAGPLLVSAQPAILHDSQVRINSRFAKGYGQSIPIHNFVCRDGNLFSEWSVVDTEEPLDVRRAYKFVNRSLTRSFDF